MLEFELTTQLPQRKLVELGKVMSRIVSMEMVIALSSRGFRQDLIDNALIELRHDISGLLGAFNSQFLPAIVDDYNDHSSWFAL